jgi:cytochrome b561
MALMIIAMLFIGAGMVASVSERHEWLIHLHKPLGVAILLLVIVRLLVRFSTRQPPLPADCRVGKRWRPRPPTCCCTP